MSKFTVDQIIAYTEKWLVTGELNATMLANNFHFISPFWARNNRAAFLAKFLDPTEYRETSLSNIESFDPIIRLKSDDKRHFSIILQYHTKNGMSIDEALLGTVEDGLLFELRSIYDVEATKQAHRLGG